MRKKREESWRERIAKQEGREYNPFEDLEMPTLRRISHEDLGEMTMSLFHEAWVQQEVPVINTDPKTARYYVQYADMAFKQGGILNKHKYAPPYTVDEFHAQDYDEHQRLIADSDVFPEALKGSALKWHHNICKMMNQLYPTKYRVFNRKPNLQYDK